MVMDEKDKVVGIITERDTREDYPQGENSSKALIKEIMTPADKCIALNRIRRWRMHGS